MERGLLGHRECRDGGLKLPQKRLDSGDGAALAGVGAEVETLDSAIGVQDDLLVVGHQEVFVGPLSNFGEVGRLAVVVVGPTVHRAGQGAQGTGGQGAAAPASTPRGSRSPRGFRGPRR